MAQARPVFDQPVPIVRIVPMDRCWYWLERGWADFTGAWRVSLVYGGLFVVASFVLLLGLWLADLLYLLLPMAAGYALVAPLIAIGLYDISRRRQGGESISFPVTAFAWRRNLEQILLMGLLLMLLHLAWVRIASLLIAFYLMPFQPTLGGVVDALLFSSHSILLLAFGSLLGGALAALSFCISALSLPMLLDRPVGVFTAVATSWTGVRYNWRPMLLWAVLIAAFTGFGIATCFIGLAVTMPLIGHATWHAYKDIVE